jgi:hypothetical protein
MDYWKPYVVENKAGFQINIDMPRHVLPHVLADDFQTGEAAHFWLAGDVGSAIVNRVVTHYKRVTGNGPFI